MKSRSLTSEFVGFDIHLYCWGAANVCGDIVCTVT